MVDVVSRDHCVEGGEIVGGEHLDHLAHHSFRVVHRSRIFPPAAALTSKGADFYRIFYRPELTSGERA
jgi:hypothetical protein